MFKIIKKVSGPVKRAGKFFYTKIHILVYLSPTVFFLVRVIKHNRLRWFAYAVGKVEFASEWLTTEGIILDDFIFGHYVFMTARLRFFISPFVLAKYIYSGTLEF